MFAHALSHFKQHDPVLYKAFHGKDPILIKKSNEYFSDLCQTIIGQQLSVKAARTIFGRFKEQFSRGIITPQKVHEIPIEKMRECGLSKSKAMFIKDLSTKVLSEEIVLEELEKLEDDIVRSALKKVKGIGDWTVEMFMMFSLGKEDVFSHSDLGLRKAIKKLYNLKEMPDKRMLEHITKKWSPYRTYASLVLWKELDSK